MITWIVTDTATGHRIAAGSHTDRAGALLDATAALRGYLAGAGATGTTETGTADIATALEHLDLTTAQLTGHLTLYPHP